MRTMAPLFILVLSILTQVITFQLQFVGKVLLALLQMSEQCGPEPDPEPTTTPAPPPQPCVLSDWEEWSGCSATCGGGKRGRVKVVRTEPACGGEPCVGDIHEIGDCNEEACESECKYTISHY